MAMQKHLDAPGTPAWHARRARCFNAGDASAMLGCHPSGKTRTQLLHELHTGLEREFSDYVQEKVINPGHRVEALWRPIAEAILGEDLQVYGASLDVDLSRPLGASLDAATFMEDTLGECKSANDALRAALPHTGRDGHAHNDARQLPKGYRVQMEQQQLVTGATRTLFSACQFDADGNVIEERHAFYTSDPELRAEILAGWKQFDADLAVYVPQAAEPPKPTGRIRESLPALIIEAKGEITASNLDTYKAQAITVIGDVPVPAKGATDQAFADGKEDGKYCRDIQDRAERAIAQLTSRMGGVHDAIQALEFIAETARRKAIDVENAVAAEEKRRKEQMQIDAATALREHVAALNSRLGGAYMPAAAAVADFAAAVKSKRSVENMQDAVDTTLAKAKSAASETADRIQVNLKTVDSVAPEHAALFPDRATIVLKAPEDLHALVRARVAEHDAAVKRRAEEAAEKERARVRAEEQERANREAREREAAERRQREEAEAAQREKNSMALQEIQGIQQQVVIATLGRAGVRKGGTIDCIRETLSETEAWLIDERFGALQGSAQAAKDKAVAEIRQLLEDAEKRAEQQRQQPNCDGDHGGPRCAAAAGQCWHDEAPAAVASQPQPATPVVSQEVAAVTDNVRPLPTRAPAAPASSPTLKLGEINARLAPLSITAEGLAQLGFPVVATERSAKLYRESDWIAMVDAMTSHLEDEVRAGGRAVVA